MSSTRSTRRAASCAAIRGRGCRAATTAPAARSPRRSPPCSPTASTCPKRCAKRRTTRGTRSRRPIGPGMGQFLPDRLFWAREDDAAPGDDADARTGVRCPQPALTTRRCGGAGARGAIAGLYAVTPDLADTADLVARVEAALDGGARAIQYRNKTADAALKRSAGRSARSRHRCAGRPLHRQRRRRALRGRGRRRRAPRRGRRRRGRRARRSSVRNASSACRATTSFARAEAAVAAGADYVAFGSFFPVAASNRPRVARTSRCSRRAAALGVPVVAIGGITAENARRARARRRRMPSR